MRVLVCRTPTNAFNYITQGWINCLQDRGHIAQRWNGDRKIWDQFDPDLYLGSSAFQQPLPSKPRKAKIALHVNSWGPISIDTGDESKEQINEASHRIQWVLRQEPDIVFGYGYERDREIWSYWEQKGNIPWTPMPTAGDKTIYRTDPNQERYYEIIYLGGRWPYKSKTLDDYLLPVLYSPLSHKVHGWGTWPANRSSGVLAEKEVPRFLRSGRIGPCVSEKHTQEFGIDIPERVFKVALSGTLAIHDPVPQFKTAFPELVMASDPQDYVDKCIYFARDDQQRKALAELQRQFVLNHHTYHHRLHDLLSPLGLDEEAKTML